MSMRSARLPGCPPLALLGIAFVGALPALAAESPLAAADRLRAATGGNVVVRYSMATGVARFVRATGDATIPLSSPPASLEDKAYRFFEEYGAVFGVTAPRQQLAVFRVTSDETGSDVRLRQSHGGLPVFNAQLVVHFDTAGAITSVNGAFIPGLK